ncbi:hypothetical protein GBAR_LOCUS1317, partial [Geodia barretti]
MMHFTCSFHSRTKHSCFLARSITSKTACVSFFSFSRALRFSSMTGLDVHTFPWNSRHFSSIVLNLFTAST